VEKDKHALFSSTNLRVKTRTGTAVGSKGLVGLGACVPFLLCDQIKTPATAQRAYHFKRNPSIWRILLAIAMRDQPSLLPAPMTISSYSIVSLPLHSLCKRNILIHSFK
jgi:hypothetical protein